MELTNLTEIYGSDIYQNNNGTSRTLSFTTLEKVNISETLRHNGYNVMCNTTFTAQALAEIRPQILYTMVENGNSVTFNCTVNWDSFIASDYNTMSLTFNGVVTKWKSSSCIKDIWHSVGLTENLDEYAVSVFDALCDEIAEDIEEEYLQNGYNFILDQDSVLYNWLKNVVCIPYLDIEDGEIKAKYYYPSELYESFYNYIYDNYAVSQEVSYTLHTKPIGTYALTTPVRLTKELFRYALLQIPYSDTLNVHQYDWYMPDSDTIYDTYVKPLLDNYHDDNNYSYCNIVIQCDGEQTSHDLTGYDAPYKIQIQFFNVPTEPSNTIEVTATSFHTDVATTTSDHCIVRTYTITCDYQTIESAHVTGSDNVPRTHTLTLRSANCVRGNAFYSRIITHGFLYGTGDSFGGGNIYRDNNTWTSTNARWGLCSARLTEIQADNHFTTWKTPEPFTPRVLYPNEIPININPEPEDEPEPTDPPVPSADPVIPVPPPVLKVIYPKGVIPPVIKPVNVVGVPPTRSSSGAKYNGMVKTWYVDNDEQMDRVNEVLWQDSALEILTQMFRNSPLDCVLRFSELYVQPVENVNYEEDGNIILGKIDCGTASSSPIISNQYIELELGQCQIPRYFDDFRDYAPYTSMQIYLPFVQWTHLNINDFIGHDIKLTATVDILTGNLVYHILSVDGNGERELYTLTGNCSNTLPLSANDRSNIVSSVIGTLSSLAVGNVFGAIGGIANIKEQTVGTGSITGNVGAMCNKKPYIVVIRPCTYDDVCASDFVGDTTNVVCNIGTLTGYVRCKDIYIDSINAPDDIKEYITDLCKSGVHIK